MNQQAILGLHHVTALAGAPQANLDFYTRVLGLRLVKKTINFDAPSVYHFYYGDRTGNPGSIMTFFPFEGARPGRRGKGQLTRTAFSIPAGSLSYWQARLQQVGVSLGKAYDRFEETVLPFEDTDGLGLELVESSTDLREGFSYGDIPVEHAIRGFYGVTLAVGRPEPTTALLTNLLNHRVDMEADHRMRLSIDGQPGQFVDLDFDPSLTPAIEGSGSVHHVAFRTPSDEQQQQLLETLRSQGLHPSPVMDRQYFHSIYFREPNGILFEVATDPPGFLIDESEAELGTQLKLPAWVEPQRAQIERGLTPVELRPLTRS